MFTSFKVNAIYWWRHHKDDVANIVFRLTFPIWLPIVLILIPLMIWDQGDPDEDEKWCKEHHFVYPDYLGWECHKQVKKWRKAYNKVKRLEEKSAILFEMQINAQQEQCWNTGVGHAARFRVGACHGCKHYDRCSDSACGY